MAFNIERKDHAPRDESYGLIQDEKITEKNESNITDLPFDEEMMKLTLKLQSINDKNGHLHPIPETTITKALMQCSYPIMKPIQNKKKKVRFSTVEIRKYEIILGDNPAVSKGPPITIDWKPFARTILRVDTHIKMNPRRRLKPKEMVLPLFHRDLLLKNSGYSRNDLLEATKQCNIIKGQRSATVRKLQMAYVEEFSETMKKKVKKTFFRKKKVG